MAIVALTPAMLARMSSRGSFKRAGSVMQVKSFRRTGSLFAVDFPGETLEKAQTDPFF